MQAKRHQPRFHPLFLAMNTTKPNSHWFLTSFSCQNTNPNKNQSPIDFIRKKKERERKKRKPESTVWLPQQHPSHLPFLPDELRCQAPPTWVLLFVFLPSDPLFWPYPSHLLFFSYRDTVAEASPLLLLLLAYLQADRYSPSPFAPHYRSRKRATSLLLPFLFRSRQTRRRSLLAIDRQKTGFPNCLRAFMLSFLTSIVRLYVLSAFIRCFIIP